MEKAMDLRHVEQKGQWYPSREAASRSRSQRRFDSVSPVRSENGMYKPMTLPSQRNLHQNMSSGAFGRQQRHSASRGALNNSERTLLMVGPHSQSVRTTTTPDLQNLHTASTPISQMTTPRKDSGRKGTAATSDLRRRVYKPMAVDIQPVLQQKASKVVKPKIQRNDQHYAAQYNSSRSPYRQQPNNGPYPSNLPNNQGYQAQYESQKVLGNYNSIQNHSQQHYTQMPMAMPHPNA